MDGWKTDLDREFMRAARARQRGNEGQARVCARRAAGIAAREYLRRQGRPVSTPSAYDLLTLLKDDPAVDSALRPLLDHLTLQVTEQFQLPVDADLVQDARALCDALLPGWDLPTLSSPPGDTTPSPRS